ncbi:MAG: MoaD/ThiS family protein [Burkholderiales bacterium]|nr:MoaD/ThiS family protein [Burkholderiales bacterium]
MKISVRYFASVRERLGAGQDLSWPDGAEGVPATVGELRQWLIGQSEDHADALAMTKGLRSACNQTMCAPGEPLTDGAEVAFFPPVTGG